MARDDDEMPWTVEMNRHLRDFLMDDWKDRREGGPRRHQEMLRVHQEGWQAVANAISRGLGEIARAIRERR